MTQKFFAMIVGTVIFQHNTTGETLSVLTNAVHARDVSDEVLTITAETIGAFETALANSAGQRRNLDASEYAVADVVVQNIVMLGAMTQEEFMAVTPSTDTSEEAPADPAA